MERGSTWEDDFMGALRCCWLRVNATYLQVKSMVKRVLHAGRSVGERLSPAHVDMAQIRKVSLEST